MSAKLRLGQLVAVEAVDGRRLFIPQRVSKYNFHRLPIDGRAIALLGDKTPRAIECRIAAAAERYRRDHDPDFRLAITKTPLFVVYQRIAPELAGRPRAQPRGAELKGLIAELDALSRIRALSDAESLRLEQLVRRESRLNQHGARRGSKQARPMLPAPAGLPQTHPVHAPGDRL